MKHMNKSFIFISIIVLLLIVGIVIYQNTSDEQSESEQVAQGIPDRPIAFPHAPSIEEEVNKNGIASVITAVNSFRARERDEITTQAIIEYRNIGFIPNAITVDAGTEIIFTNKSAEAMSIAPRTTPSGDVVEDPCLGQSSPSLPSSCREVEYFSMVLDEEGEWRFSNPLNPSNQFIVTVTPATTTGAQNTKMAM